MDFSSVPSVLLMFRILPGCAILFGRKTPNFKEALESQPPLRVRRPKGAKSIGSYFIRVIGEIRGLVFLVAARPRWVIRGSMVLLLGALRLALDHGIPLRRRRHRAGRRCQ